MKDVKEGKGGRERRYERSSQSYAGENQGSKFYKFYLHKNHLIIFLLNKQILDTKILNSEIILKFYVHICISWQPCYERLSVPISAATIDQMVMHIEF